jgi:hypothetical protein
MHLRQFLFQMDLQLTFEKYYRLGYLGEIEHVVDPARYVRQTSPFVNCPPGFIRDVRYESSKVPCPRDRELIESLGAIVGLYAQMFNFAGPARTREERLQIESAFRTIQIFLENERAAMRHKKLWCEFEDVKKAVLVMAKASKTGKRGQERFAREWRDWWTEKQGNMSIQLYDAFRCFGPDEKDFCKDAIYEAMAAILIDLGFESTSLKSLPQALLRRRTKALKST